MGNCLRTPEKLTAEIIPHAGATVYPAVRLYGSPESVLAAYIHFALLHEAVSSDFVPSAGTSSAPTTATAHDGGSNRDSAVMLQVGSEVVSGSRDARPRFREARFRKLSPATAVASIGGGIEEGTTSDFVVRTLPAPARGGGSGPDIPVNLRLGPEVVSGSQDALLRFIDSRFPSLSPAAAGSGGGSEEGTTSLVTTVTRLQHKSMTWQLERMLRWAEDMATRGGKKAVDPKVGNWRMEVRKFGRSYSQLLEVMLEHAQMEERILFPIFDIADRGLSKAAKEDHARDLPIMNGIKEIIKSVEVLDSRSPNYREALYNLSTRLKSLQGQCKQHFMEEDVELLPLMEAVELSKDQDVSALEQCFDVMQGTHSRLLKFLLEGLPSRDAMKYLDLISKCRDKERMESMLRMIVE